MNRLASESSLYLRQHASNPVDWWPWCPEAFALAQREDKPVLVSIGYSSCHWCHVMAHECFEDDYIASIMNRHFVCIKVDREERPDLDQIYMESVQMLNQQGGWPLNVFCLPDGRPFTGGTYFPPEDLGHGIIPWPHLLVRIAEAYRVQRADLEANADAIVHNLSHLSGAILSDAGEWEDASLVAAASRMVEQADPVFGGFGPAPKFPPGQTMGFFCAVLDLLAADAVEDAGVEETLASRLEASLLRTSRALVRGGLFDHVAGGFFRYSVDAAWRVPHYEKMLYDNALIPEALLKVWSRYRLPWIQDAVRRSLEWMLAEFQVREGIFAASMDADSPEGEGRYYLWSLRELELALPSRRMSAFSEGFQVRGSDPLNLYPWDLEDEAYESFLPLLDDLREIRSRRAAPGRDDKVLVAWNALVLRTFAMAGIWMNEPRWLACAKTGLDWIWDRLSDGKGGIAAVEKENDLAGWQQGFLDDHVFYATACLQVAAGIELLQPGASENYVARARCVADRVIADFADLQGDGFFFCTEPQAASLIVRKKEWFDQAYPSGNSMLVHLFSQLFSLTGHVPYAKVLEGLRRAYAERCRRIPNGVACGLEGLVREQTGHAVFRIGSFVDPALLWAQLRQGVYRPVFVLSDPALSSGAVQLCLGHQCFAPLEGVDAAISHWRALAPPRIEP
jgi:uncharacterized protein YyaL (SSP411 family)